MSNDGALRLTPDEARELREAAERLVRDGLAWLEGPSGDAAAEGAAVPKDGPAARRSDSLFPPR